MPSMSDSTHPPAPLRRHPREIVNDVRVRFSRDEARMLSRLQRDYDVPFAVLLRLLVRDEFHRSYAAPARAFGEFDKPQEEP